MCWTICYTTIPTHMPRPLHLSESYCWDQTFCRRPKPPPHAFVPATAVGAWPKCSPIAVRLILSDCPTAHRIRMRLCAFVYGPWPLKLFFMLLKFFQLCLSFCLGEKRVTSSGKGLKHWQRCGSVAPPHERDRSQHHDVGLPSVPGPASQYPFSTDWEKYGQCPQWDFSEIALFGVCSEDL